MTKITCADCGAEVERTGRAQKRCPACSVERARNKRHDRYVADRPAWNARSVANERARREADPD